MIEKQYLSVKKVKKILNWTLAYDLNRGIAKTINWYKEFLLHE